MCQTPQHHPVSSRARTMIQGADECKVSISTEGQPTNAAWHVLCRAGALEEHGRLHAGRVRGSDCREQGPETGLPLTGWGVREPAHL